MTPKEHIRQLDAQWTQAELLLNLNKWVETRHADDRARAWTRWGPKKKTGQPRKLSDNRIKALRQIERLHCAEPAIEWIRRRSERRVGMVWKIYEKHRTFYRIARTRWIQQMELAVASRFQDVATADAYYYSTVGFGKNKYAEAEAKFKAMTLEAAGIPTIVGECQSIYAKPKRETNIWHSSGPSLEYHVNARCDDLDYEAARMHDDTDLVEQVRLCWANGVNPRVYMPMLPHGFEEKHGLDYQGNRK